MNYRDLLTFLSGPHGRVGYMALRFLQLAAWRNHFHGP
jgi:hypothetical protein